ncbi:MAG: hypothetical protein M1829_001034 [Trizodia sp. TS-e1964]|nr:MAG: hypothetical protein M1829_001034 [Trizodia sp. TS-e1964]
MILNTLSSYFQHLRDCRLKQAQRASRIDDLPESYNGPITPENRQVLERSVANLVIEVHQDKIKPIDILRAYGKIAIRAHMKTNCLTEIVIQDAENWAANPSPLAGIPLSLKDTIHVGGYDASVGYSANTGNPVAKDGPMVKLLKDAGAIPYVKTALPITLLSFESTNDVWGRCTNPYNPKYTPGGSSGGEAALLALGGGRIGIGSDVAGSVRVPAHFSGIYTIRCSTGRWPKAGISTSTAGQEGVPSVYSPMARTLEDLTYFTQSMLSMKPWKYDHSVHPIGWREDHAQEMRDKKQFKIGILRDDGVVPPSPACARALEAVVSALRSHGHILVDIMPPSPSTGLILGSRLLNADGCRTFCAPLRPGETEDPGAAQMAFYASLPRPLKYLYHLWVKYIRRDALWAQLLDGWRGLSCFEQWRLVARREAYRAEWHEWYEEGEYDFLLTVPNAMPALPHGAMRDSVASCGYTFLFNLLDYSCGVLPVTHVDCGRDALPLGFNVKALNGVARGAYKHYDADEMHGLPVGVQVVGQRLQEEKVLAVMQRIEDALRDSETGAFKQLDID